MTPVIAARPALAYCSGAFSWYYTGISEAKGARFIQISGSTVRSVFNGTSQNITRTLSETVGGDTTASANVTVEAGVDAILWSASAKVDVGIAKTWSHSATESTTDVITPGHYGNAAYGRYASMFTGTLYQLNALCQKSKVQTVKYTALDTAIAPDWCYWESTTGAGLQRPSRCSKF